MIGLNSFRFVPFRLASRCVRTADCRLEPAARFPRLIREEIVSKNGENLSLAAGRALKPRSRGSKSNYGSGVDGFPFRPIARRLRRRRWEPNRRASFRASCSRRPRSHWAPPTVSVSVSVSLTLTLLAVPSPLQCSSLTRTRVRTLTPQLSSLLSYGLCYYSHLISSITPLRAHLTPTETNTRDAAFQTNFFRLTHRSMLLRRSAAYTVQQVYGYTVLC